MTKFDKAMLIAAPVHEVFDYVSRPEHFPEFLPISRLTFLTHMHRGEGTRVGYTRTLDRRRVPAECGLSQLKMDEMVEFSATKGLMRVWRFSIQGLEGGTQLRWEGEYDLPSGLMDRVSGHRGRSEGAVPGELDESLRRIKQAIESE